MRGCVLVLAAAVAACGGERDARRDAPGDAAAPAPRGTPDLLAGVPEDSAFVLALREPLPAAVWDRLAWDLGPFVARLAAVGESRLGDGGLIDPGERLVAALIAELPGPLGAGTRAVAHELGGVLVLRLEVPSGDDEAALAAAVERATRRAGVPASARGRWIAESADGAIALVVTGRHLAIAVGAADGVRATLPVIAGDAPLAGTPIDPAGLPALGGRIDLGAVARQTRPSDDATPACRAAVAEVLGQLAPVLPRVTLEARALTAERAELVASVDLDPALAAALHGPPAVTPGVPASFPGRPIVGIALAPPVTVNDSMLSALWTGPLLRVATACDSGVEVDALPGEGTVRGGALALYGATMDGFFPTDIQAYATVLARDPAALLADLGRTLRGVLGKRPPDDGRLRPIPSKGLEPFVASAHLARKGEAIVLAVGKTGREHAAAALAAAEPPPVFHVFLDVARITAPDPEPADAIDVGGAGYTDEADLGGALARLVDTFDLAIAGEMRVVTSFQPRAAAPAPATLDPGRLAATACRRLLDRSWTSAAGSLARLGITPPLDEYEERFKKGFDTPSFLRACGELPEAARSCLRAAADPLAALSDCRAYAVEPPRLFDTFSTDPHPMDVRLAAGAPTMAQLAGTWESVWGDTWEIAASGKASHRYRSGGRERYTLSVVSDGRLRMKYPDGGWSHMAFLLAGPDELYLPDSERVWPMPSETEFIVGYRSTWTDVWIVRDAQGCIEIDDRARTRPADCDFVDRDGRRVLRAQGREYVVVDGHLVEAGGEDDLYRRKR